MTGPGAHGGRAYVESHVGDAIELADLRVHVDNLAAASGFGDDARRRAVQAVHEAAALACRLVGGDADPGSGTRPADRCTVRLAAEPELLVAEIELPRATSLPARQRDGDPLHYVRTFAPETGWTDGPEAPRLRVAVRDDR